MFPKLQAFFARCRNVLLAVARALPFRKRGGSYMAIAVVMFVIVLSFYLLSGFFRGMDTPLQTVTAVEYESSAACYSSGYVVRDETVITSSGVRTSLVLSEGQMASVGEPVAMGYTSAEAQQEQNIIAELEEQLIQLQYAAGTSTATYDQAAMDAQIRDELLSVSTLLNKNRIADIRDTTPHLKGLILRSLTDEDGLKAIQTEIDRLNTEISARKSTLSGSVSNVPAPRAGYFSGNADGFETILTPDSITSMTVSRLESLSSNPPPASAVGKIISGNTWYYITAIPAEQAAKLRIGSSVSVAFAQNEAGRIAMTISHLGQEEDGKVFLALSCDHFLQDMTLMRQQNADIIFSTHTGLRVPKQAIHVKENGAVGVYVLESAAATWKNVQILHDNGESYIVALDKSSTDNLWPGDEIIVTATDGLYEGKVVS